MAQISIVRNRFGGGSVRWSAAALADFAKRWPGYRGPVKAGWCMFGSDGSLVELSPGWAYERFDLPELSAIVDDSRDLLLGRV